MRIWTGCAQLRVTLFHWLWRIGKGLRRFILDWVIIKYSDSVCCLSQLLKMFMENKAQNICFKNNFLFVQLSYIVCPLNHRWAVGFVAGFSQPPKLAMGFGGQQREQQWESAGRGTRPHLRHPGILHFRCLRSVSKHISQVFHQGNTSLTNEIYRFFNFF